MVYCRDPTAAAQHQAKVKKCGYTRKFNPTSPHFCITCTYLHCNKICVNLYKRCYINKQLMDCLLVGFRGSYRMCASIMTETVYNSFYQVVHYEYRLQSIFMFQLSQTRMALINTISFPKWVSG